MDLFNNIETTTENTEEEDVVLQPQGESLETPQVEPETTEEAMLSAKYAVEEVEKEESPTTKQVIAGLTAEIAISGGGQAASAAAAGGTAATGVGVVASPFVWVGGTFSSGYAGSVAAQKIEGREDVSQGRALFAGLVNTIPFVGKARQGTKLAKLTKQVGAHAAQGAAMGAGEMTSVAIIDEERLPTLGELGFGAAGGAVIGSALGGTIEGGKVLAPKTVQLFNKISGKTAPEIDVMVAKGEVLTEDISEAVDDIAEAPKTKPDPEAPATPKEQPKTGFDSLTDAEKKLKREIALKYKDEVLDKAAEVRAKFEPKLKAVRGNQKETYKLLEKQDKAVKKAVQKIHDEGMAEFEAARAKLPKEAPATPKDAPEPTSAPKTRTEDGNDFAPDVEDIIISAGFNPDTFWRRPTYAQRAIDDMRNDVEIINNPQDKDSIAFEKAIKAIEETQTPKAPAEPTPAPKTPKDAPEPEAPKADPIDEAIEAVDGILTGDRTGGKGARVTRKAKRLFRTVTREFFNDVNDLIKNKDVAGAKKILARIDKYKEFDRKISEKDYAQGSELQANSRNAMENGTTEYTSGISAGGNKRTENLNVLKGMLRKFVDAEDVIDDIAKQADEAKPTNKNVDPSIDPEVTPVKPSKEEMIDAIADQTAKTFASRRTGVLQQVVDGYFTLRLTQMLNQAKTAFVGVPSAVMMAVVRPIINTPYNIAKSMQLKDATLARRLQYASADIAGTYEYVRMMTKHLKDTLRSSKDTILNRGDSNFLYRDRNAYIKDELAEATEAPYRVKRKLAQSQRRVEAANAETAIGRKVLTAKATVMNSKSAQVPAFFFDYGVSLIGGLEEISLIAHSMRAARAKGIKKGIDEGVDDVWKFSEDYMEGAFDRSRGTLQAKYDPEYADIFNQARRDHFRAMDLDPNDIRKDLIDGVVSALSKTSMNHDEMGFIARTLFVFIGVPMRALGTSMSFIAAPLNVAKNVTGGGARRLEQALGGTATFGKYNKKISELELDIKEQKGLLKSEDADVVKTAEKKLAELENDLAYNKDLKMQKDYEDLGKLGVGAGLFFLGYEMAKNGQVAGTDSWMTEEQKLAAQKVQGAPNSWKVVMGGSEYDFRYFDPLKGVFALGADVARREAAKEAGALTDDQTMVQFITSVSKSIATDSPFATGARYVTQIMSPNPSTQERGVMGVVRSMVPVPAEVRNFNKFDEEFVTDTTAGNSVETVLKASMGQETGNYRLTSLGEPKLKEDPSLLSYILPFAGKAVPEREPIDDILLEDAMSYRSVSDVQTSVSGMKLKDYVNEDNEDLYSHYGRLISTEKLGGKNLRQALNALVKTPQFKTLYKEGYVMNERGTEENAGIEMIKDIISDYKENAREILLNSKTATDYVDGDGNNIYDIFKEREAYSERPDGLLETLNIEQ